MYKVADFYNVIDRIAPFSTAEEWDNCGLLIGSGELAAEKTLLALDVTSAVLEEAVRLGARLIITHHPVIFKPLLSIPAHSLVYRLAAYGISVISAHTNLDLAGNGVNDALARVLGLIDIRPIPGTPVRLGRLESALTASGLAALVKEKLDTGARYVKGRENAANVAVCAGSGGEYMELAIKAGAQAYITGEARHHQLLEACEAGLTLIEAGHFATETVVMPVLAKQLGKALPGADIVLSETCSDGVCFIGN